MRHRFATYIAYVFVIAALCHPILAETGYDAWLRYAPLGPDARSQYASLPGAVVVLNDSPILASAQSEMIRGLQSMLTRPFTPEKSIPARPAILLGTLPELKHAGTSLNPPAALHDDGYWLTSTRIRGHRYIVISGLSDRGVLYGTFAWLSKIARNQDVRHLDEAQSPFVPLRWINQWDNPDGTIERGYGGRSIFFDDGAVRGDLSRVHDYARLLASLGINGCVINNVNASPKMLAADFIPQLARVADELRPWGIRLGLSVNFASPKLIGGLDTFDPLDPKVATWWKDKVDELYRAIPDFGGFVLKADSEGQLGPAQYGRTPADAANVVGCCVEATRRIRLLSRVCLQPSSRLDQP